MSATDLENWVKDADAPTCQICSTWFSMFYRRHHCRMCGSVVCYECSTNSAPLLMPPSNGRGELKPQKGENSAPVLQKVCDICYAKLDRAGQLPKADSSLGQSDFDDDEINSCICTSSDDDDDPILQEQPSGTGVRKRLDSASGRPKRSQSLRNRNGSADSENLVVSAETESKSTHWSMDTESGLPGYLMLVHDWFRSYFLYLAPLLHLLQIVVLSHSFWQYVISLRALESTLRSFGLGLLVDFCGSSLLLPVRAFLALLQHLFRLSTCLSLLYWFVYECPALLFYAFWVRVYWLCFGVDPAHEQMLSLSGLQQAAVSALVYLKEYAMGGLYSTAFFSGMARTWVSSAGDVRGVLEVSCGVFLRCLIASHLRTVAQRFLMQKKES